VRAQAAISLGNVEAERGVLDALSAALVDTHPAVRAAAANSLGRLGDSSVAAALRRASEDREAPVRVAAKAALAKLRASSPRDPVVDAPTAGPARYYVAVGRPSSRVSGVTPPMLETAQRLMRDRLVEIDGVELAPDGEAPKRAGDVLRSRRLRGFYIESSVTSVEDKADGATRVAVSVILATYPGRDMRAILQGAATAMGGRDQREQAMAGAIRSALRQLPQALQRE
jgi:hypothetical protein